MRLIIVLRGYHPSTHPPHIGGFDWSTDHECYVWQGRELRPAEFNHVIDGVLDTNRDLWAQVVTVRIVGEANENHKSQNTKDKMTPHDGAK